MKTLTLLLACLTIFQGSAQAQTGTPVFPNPSARGRHLPKMTVAPNGSVVLTFAEKVGTKARYFVSVSSNAGLAFTSPQFVGEADFGAAILQRQPYVVMDKSNAMHVLLEQAVQGGAKALHHQFSTDMGATWSMPVQISAEPPARPQDFASIVVSESGSIYVSFISVLATATDGYTHIYLVRSDDGGKTWTKEKRVDSFPVGGCCECCNQNIIIAPNGDVVIAFRSNIENRRDIHISRSKDGGQTFATPQLIQAEPWFINGCPGTGPSVQASASGRLHIAWRDTRDTRYAGSCYYAEVPPNSTVTPVNVLLNPPLGTDGEYPIVATNPEGTNVAIVYHAFDGVFYTEREMLPERKEISPQGLPNPCVGVVWHGNGFLTIWQEQRGSVADIVSYRTDITSNVSDDREHSVEQCSYSVFVDLRGRITTSNTANQLKFGVCTLEHQHTQRVRFRE